MFMCKTALAGAYTVLVIIKLTECPVPVRLRCGSGKMYFVTISSCFEIYKKVAHSLKPGETPSLTRLETICNVLKYCKIFKNGSVRLRLVFSINLNSVLYLCKLHYCRDLPSLPRIRKSHNYRLYNDDFETTKSPKVFP